MTSIAMVVAMFPLLLATGPGAASRYQIGLVIAAGLGVGTLFTLFVVPAFYLVLGQNYQREGALTEAQEEADEQFADTAVPRTIPE